MAGGYTWLANTFKTVDGSTVKLKNFSIIDAYAPSVVKIYLMNEEGATLVKDSKLQIFRYVHPDKCTTKNLWLPGWYYDELNGTAVSATEYKKGSESDYWAGEVDIPAGQGLAILKTTEDEVHFVVPTPIPAAQ